MSKFAVVYWSGTGNTEAMANAVVDGINGNGGEAVAVTVSDFSPSDVANYDGFAFGCPSSGAETLEEGEFAPLWDNVVSDLKEKKVVLFGSYGWGGGAWMTDWKASAEESGTNILDTFVCENAPDDDALASCVALGKTVATS